jgi:putative hydrolase of the HAD superfamily
MALEFNDSYVSRCSSKTHLVPHSREILQYLSDNYILHIITNGFKEAQYVKLDKSGIRPFFKEVIVSDELGFNKPDLRIFNHALNVSDASLDESIMIGDDFEADILGAKEAGMDQVFYHAEATHEEKAEATYTVGHLEELREIF